MLLISFQGNYDGQLTEVPECIVIFLSSNRPFYRYGSHIEGVLWDAQGGMSTFRLVFMSAFWDIFS